MTQGKGEAFLAGGLLHGGGKTWPDSADAFTVELSVLVDWM